MVSKVCSRSQGHPSGPRSRAMMETDSSNRAAALAGSDLRSTPGADVEGSGLSALPAASIAFSLTRWSNAGCDITRCDGSTLRKQAKNADCTSTERILDVSYASVVGNRVCGALRACLRQLPECVLESLAGRRERGHAVFALLDM